MAWRALVIDDLRRKRMDGITASLFAAGAAGVQEEPAGGKPPVLRQPWDDGPEPPPPDPVRLRAWFEDPDEDAIVGRVGKLPRLASSWWEDVEEQDWETSWQQGFAPIVISDRLTVAPPWDAPEGALIIEPGQGFGTGQHETTRQALTLLDAVTSRDPSLRTALDVGCGSGVLALAAVRLGLHAEGVDVDPVAVTDAVGNAARNGLTAPFSTTPLEDVPGVWDVVLANLFAETLIALSASLIAHTGRFLIVAGVLADREPGVRAAFDPALGQPTRLVDGEWIGLCWERR